MLWFVDTLVTGTVGEYQKAAQGRGGESKQEEKKAREASDKEDNFESLTWLHSGQYLEGDSTFSYAGYQYST